MKPLDAWWTVVLIDPLAVRLVSLVQRFESVTPTHLTVLAHLLGVFSAVTFAAGQLVISAVLFEVRFILDCADGKLARVRGTSSAAGAFLDYVGDYVVVGANVVGLALHLQWGGDVPVWLAVALPAVFVTHVAVGQARRQEVVLAGIDGPMTAHHLPGGYRQWMADRRLRAVPSRIDVEHGLLFVAPLAAVLLDTSSVLVVGAWLAASYFGYEVLHLTRLGYRLAQERDRG
jgi:phosphatidylglycerophosphate synthase